MGREPEPVLRFLHLRFALRATAFLEIVLCQSTGNLRRLNAWRNLASLRMLGYAVRHTLGVLLPTLHGSSTMGWRAHTVESAGAYVDSTPIQDCFGDCSVHDAESPQPGCRVESLRLLIINSHCAESLRPLAVSPKRSSSRSRAVRVSRHVVCRNEIHPNNAPVSVPS